MDLDLCVYNLHLKDLLQLDAALRQEKHMVGGVQDPEACPPCAWSPGDAREMGISDSRATAEGGERD